MNRVSDALRMVVALVGAIVLMVGALPCASQAMTNDCMASMAGHQGDRPAHSSKSLAGPDCAIGCRLAPPVAPSVVPPVPVSYSVTYPPVRVGGDGLPTDPADPPPR